MAHLNNIARYFGHPHKIFWYLYLDHNSKNGQCIVIEVSRIQLYKYVYIYTS